MFRYKLSDVVNYIFNYCCPIKLEDGKKAWLER